MCDIEIKGKQCQEKTWLRALPGRSDRPQVQPGSGSLESTKGGFGVVPQGVRVLPGAAVEFFAEDGI